MDDGSAASSDIDAAFKLTGTTGSVVYGGFVAQEDDYRNGPSRLFAATRVALPMESCARRLSGHLDRPAVPRIAMRW